VPGYQPKHKPQPDFSRLARVLTRSGSPDRVPFIELFADAPVMAAILGEPVAETPGGEGADTSDRSILQRIEFNYRMGYDYANMWPNVKMPMKRDIAPDTAQLPGQERAWVNQSIGLVGNRDEFQQYPWPDPADFDYSRVEFMVRNLRDGMKLIAMIPGILETVMWLAGYEQLSYQIADDPEFVQQFFDRVGGLFLHVVETSVTFDNVGAVWYSDDMGFKTGPMMSPAHLRQYVFPWLKRYSKIVHQHGLPFLIHCCGNIRLLMEDFIENIGFDGKHSFEDVIQPVADFKREYGDRIAALGGIDMDFIASADQESVHGYVRRVLDECMPRGGYALGTGNSVANYIPVENYIAMLEEGRAWS